MHGRGAKTPKNPFPISISKIFPNQNWFQRTEMLYRLSYFYSWMHWLRPPKNVFRALFIHPDATHVRTLISKVQKRCKKDAPKQGPWTDRYYSLKRVYSPLFLDPEKSKFQNTNAYGHVSQNLNLGIDLLYDKDFLYGFSRVGATELAPNLAIRSF